jgi:uncharacterized protein YdeI (YjbR/CyaY-like superfamily)
MKNIKETSKNGTGVNAEYDREIIIPEKLKVKLDELQKEREKINREIDSIFQNLIEGFLSDKSVSENEHVVYIPDSGVFRINKK